MSSYRIVFVCLGNICRSPIAETVMRALLEERGLAGEVEVASAGTGDWHVGERADRRALDVLGRNGYDASAHRARQFDASWFDRYDLVLALDRANLEDLRRMAGPDDRDKVRLLLSFDPAGSGDDVPDPYYGGERGFDDTLALVERACRGLLDHVAAQRPA